MVNFTALKYDNTYEYPWWGYAIGIFLALLSVLLTPLWLIYNMSVTPGTLRQVRELKVQCIPLITRLSAKGKANRALCHFFYLNLCKFFCLNK